MTFLQYLKSIFKDSLTSNEQHRAIIEAESETFKDTENDIHLARLEMSLENSTGFWLDVWASYFSVFRKTGESDLNFRARAINSVKHPKSTLPAIKNGIANFLNLKYDKNYTQEEIFIREPFKNLSKYSHKGLLSKDARFVSGDYYTHAVIDISIPERITQDLIDFVNSIKAGGVKVFWSVLNQYEIVDEFAKENAIFAMYSRHLTTYVKEQMFSGLLLSNSSKKPTLSGRQVIWTELASLYEMYTESVRDTNNSNTLSYKDMFMFLVESGHVELSDSELMLLDSLFKKLEYQMLANKVDVPGISLEEHIAAQVAKSGKFSQSGLLSISSYFFSNTYFNNLTQELIDLYGTEEFELLKKLLMGLKSYQEANKIMFSDLQSLIVVGDVVKWFVESDKLYVWNLKAIQRKELFELYEGSESFHTRNAFLEHFSTGDNWKSLGIDYQAPIDTSEPFLWIIKEKPQWLFDSKTLQVKDLESIMQGRTKMTNPTVTQMVSWEKSHGTLTNRRQEQSEIV